VSAVTQLPADTPESPLILIVLPGRKFAPAVAQTAVSVSAVRVTVWTQSAAFGGVSGPPVAPDAASVA